MSAEHAVSREGEFIVVTVFGAKRGAHARQVAMTMLNDGESLAQTKVEHPMYWFEAIAPPDPWILSRERNDEYKSWKLYVHNEATLLGWMEWLEEYDAGLDRKADDEEAVRAALGTELEQYDEAEQEPVDG